MGREVHQVAAGNERNYLHAWGEDLFIQFLDLGVDSREYLVGVCALAQEHDARAYIAIIDDLAVFAMNVAGELAQPNLRPFPNGPLFFHPPDPSPFVPA